MYYDQGFLKKYPLREREFIVGRSPRCDLIVENELFSRQHLRCVAEEGGLAIEDLKSTNGTYVNGQRVDKARVELNGSFVVGTLRFYLKEGSLEEFAPSKELIPIFNELAKEAPRSLTETRYIRDIYREILKNLLSEGLAKSDWAWFLKQLAYHVENLSELGDLALLKKTPQEVSVVLSVFKGSGSGGCLQEFIADFDRQVHQVPKGRRPLGKNRFCYCFPLVLDDCPGALVYNSLPGRVEENERIVDFVSQLAKEIELLGGMGMGQDRLPVHTQGGEGKSDVEIVASSPVMKNLVSQAKKMARSDIFVLIHGESGTGKELFARLIHEHSSRKAGQFVALNCAAIPEHLLEAELFGSERGAYTGAFARKHGKLELASGGTLVLDEIGDMPLAVQTKLLRALQENEFYRLGGNEPIKVDLRIISLTHRDLKRLIADNRFRHDLYYRLVHHIIHVPPLRERPEDIASLINHFSYRYCSKISRPISGFSVQAHQVLMKYEWPGNVRQLENEVKRVVNLAEDGDVISLDLLSEEIRSSVLPVLGEPGFGGETAEGGGQDLMSVLESCGWSQSQAARKLGMTYQGLHKKIKKLGLDTMVREKRTGGEA